MTVAIAIYQNIYCRYLAPGECIVHDRGKEFCNAVHDALHELFGVDIRIISAGKPRGNGLIVSKVKVLKEKMRACISESGGDLPTNWDVTLMLTRLFAFFAATQVERQDSLLENC